MKAGLDGKKEYQEVCLCTQQKSKGEEEGNTRVNQTALKEYDLKKLKIIYGTGSFGVYGNERVLANSRNPCNNGNG